MTHNQLTNLVHLRERFEERLVKTLGFWEITFCIAGIVHSYKPYQIKGSVVHLTRPFVPVPVDHSHLDAKAPHFPYSVQTQQSLVLWYGWEGGTEDGLRDLESCLLDQKMVHRLLAWHLEHLAIQPVLGLLVPLGWSHAVVVVETGEVSNVEEEKNEEVSGDLVLVNHIHC